MMDDPRRRDAHLHPVNLQDCPHPRSHRRDASHAQTPQGQRDVICGACGDRWREPLDGPADDHVAAFEVGYLGGDGRPMIIERVALNGADLPAVTGVTVIEELGQASRLIVEFLPTSLTRVNDEERPDVG